MTAPYKILISISILLLSLPALAGDQTANVLITFYNTYEDVLKSITPLIVAIVTVGGAIFVTKIARKAPDAAVKLEQLKFIEGLVYDKAWSKPDSYFVVEEAFKQYYNTYIPIEIIKLLAKVEDRFFAFSSYAKVGGLISFDKETKKIKSLSKKGKNVRVGMLFSLIITFVHILFLCLFLSLFMFSKDNFLNIALGGVFAIFSAFCAWAVYEIFDKIIDFKKDFRDFESKLKGKLEATEINKSDLRTITMCVFIVSFLWIARLCLYYYST